MSDSTLTDTPLPSSPIVPEPPEKQVVVPEDAKDRLQKWFIFLANISPRIAIINPTHIKFKDWHQFSHKNLIAKIGSGNKAVGFPKLDDIAFFIGINASLDIESREILQENVWLFTYHNIAFQITHFRWDDEEDIGGKSSNTFSLSRWRPELLTWEFITGLIISRLKKIEDQVPPSPPETPRV